MLGVLAVVLLVIVILVVSFVHLTSDSDAPSCYDPIKDEDRKGNLKNLPMCKGNRFFIGGSTEKGDCPNGSFKDYNGVCQKAFTFEV